MADIFDVAGYMSEQGWGNGGLDQATAEAWYGGDQLNPYTIMPSNEDIEAARRTRDQLEHPSYTSGGRPVVWNSDMQRYVYADAARYGGGSPTDWAGAQAGSASVSGGTSGGGGGGGGGASGSTDISSIAAQLRALMDQSDGASGGSSSVYRNTTPGVKGIDTGAVLSRMDRLFADLTSRASQRADAAMANYRGQTAGVNEYLQENFAQGLSQRMVEEYTGRLRQAQAARGLAFGGQAAVDEAALLTGMAEKNRAALASTMLESAKTEASLSAGLEQAFMGTGAQAAQAASQQGAVLSDIFKAGIGGTLQQPTYESVLEGLFG